MNFFLLLIYQNFLPLSNTTPDNPELTYEHLYQYGKREYTDQQWRDCVAFMLSAVEDYKYFIGEVEWCRTKCSKIVETRKPKELISEGDELFDIAYMYGHAQQALCLFRCKHDRFTGQRPPLLKPAVFEDFQRRKPFQYLQFCYWKMGDLAAATRSAYTYLVANPTDPDALENVAFYMEQKGFKETMLVDAMRMPYEEKYMRGVAAYNELDFLNCAIEFESAVKDFYQEEEKCRKICEDKLDWETIDGVNPEMTIVLTSVYTSVLRCKNACAKKLSFVNGHNEGFLLSKIYEYLHVCQYNLKRGRDVCQSVANSILLNPSNLMMRQNKYIYMKIYADDKLFEPSHEVIKFYKRDVMEKLFLEFVDQKFKYENGELPSERQEDRVALKTEIPVKDYFDYRTLEQELLSEAECGALSIAAIFENSRSPELHAVDDVKLKLNQIFGVQANFLQLSCSTDKTLPKCEKNLAIISLDRNRCGAFLNKIDVSGCSIVFCVQ